MYGCRLVMIMNGRYDPKCPKEYKAASTGDDIITLARDIFLPFPPYGELKFVMNNKFDDVSARIGITSFYWHHDTKRFFVELDEQSDCTLEMIKQDLAQGWRIYMPSWYATEKEAIEAAHGLDEEKHVIQIGGRDFFIISDADLAALQYNKTPFELKYSTKGKKPPKK